jgi:hypothetical protein
MGIAIRCSEPECGAAGYCQLQFRCRNGPSGFRTSTGVSDVAGQEKLYRTAPGYTCQKPRTGRKVAGEFVKELFLVDKISDSEARRLRIDRTKLQAHNYLYVTGDQGL